MSESGHFVINTDGGARSNPGPAAIGYVIQQDGRTVAEGKKYIGETTNNIAEYTAVIHALTHAKELGGKRIEIRADSELMVNQLAGAYQVKNAGLKPLYDQVIKQRREFDGVVFKHIRRENNKRADELCNEAMDEHLYGGGGRAEKPKKPTATAKKRRTISKDVQGNVRDEAVECLRTAAQAWSKGDASHPSPDDVWEQLWSILEEAGVVPKSSVQS